MGMTLVPNNPAVGDDDYNWTGWRYMKDLLTQLGEATSRMAASNDGALISNKTCKKWGTALLQACQEHSISEVAIPDERYEGGVRHDPIVSKAKSGTLSVASQQWIEDHAHFFLTCGGCRQY